MVIKLEDGFDDYILIFKVVEITEYHKLSKFARYYTFKYSIFQFLS